MKISFNDQELFTLSETQKNVIKDNVSSSMFEDDMKRRLTWVIMHKYEECLKSLKKEWEQKLKDAGIEMIPTNDEAFAQLVFSQPSYKDRYNRDFASQLQE